MAPINTNPLGESSYFPGTLGDALLRLDASCLTHTEHLVWPPDAFCIAAYVLKLSGGYVHVLHEWPPQSSPGENLYDGSGHTNDDPFLTRASALLIEPLDDVGGASLSPRVPKGYARVLPKQHTPRGGLTLRSLTHHLALHVGSEVTPFWYTVPKPRARSINLLVAPWPLEIVPNQFQPAAGALHEMPERFCFVEYHPNKQPTLVAEWTRRLIDEARRVAWGKAQSCRFRCQR
jgi:hypothetical protein